MNFKAFKTLFIIFVSIIIVSCDANDKSIKNKNSFSLSALEEEYYLEKGMAIMLETGNSLSTQLKAKLSEGGVETAINYCNVAALPLTDSIASLYQVAIRRVSDKTRNQANVADSLESQVISNYKQLLKEGKQITPLVVNQNGSIRFMSPVIVNDLCLKCHGIPGENIAANDMALILSYYPLDKAVDYKTGDLRGIWSLTFSK